MRRIIHAFSRPMSSSCSHPSLSLFIAQWGRGFVPNFNFLHLISGMAGPVPGPRVTHIFPIEMFRDEMMGNIICISRDNCYNDVTMRSSWECWERLASEHLASHVPDAVSEGKNWYFIEFSRQGIWLFPHKTKCWCQFKNRMSLYILLFLSTSFHIFPQKYFHMKAQS